MAMFVTQEQLLATPDLARHRDFIRALGVWPVRQCWDGIVCVEADKTGERVLAAARKCALDDWKEKMQAFTRPGYTELPANPISPICLLAGYVAQIAGLPVEPPTTAFYRRTRNSGYVFLWMSGLDFFLAMNPRGSRHSYHRFWLGITDFPPNRRDKRSE